MIAQEQEKHSPPMSYLHMRLGQHVYDGYLVKEKSKSLALWHNKHRFRYERNHAWQREESTGIIRVL